MQKQVPIIAREARKVRFNEGAPDGGAILAVKTKIGALPHLRFFSTAITLLCLSNCLQSCGIVPHGSISGAAWLSRTGGDSNILRGLDVSLCKPEAMQSKAALKAIIDEFSGYAIPAIVSCGFFEKLTESVDKLVAPYIIKTVKANVDGKYTLSDLPDGDYVIFAKFRTNASYAVWLHPVTVRFGQTTNLDLDNSAAQIININSSDTHNSSYYVLEILKAWEQRYLHPVKEGSSSFSTGSLDNVSNERSAGTAQDQASAAITKTSASHKQICTYSDFEKSFLYNELHFQNLKNPDGYRLYKDENNNYIVALQVDKQGNILRERILPMQKVGSKSQNSGLFFFVIDFICGDGAALSDINASNRMKPYVTTMFTEQGAQIDQFNVSLAYDPWKIRSGLDIRTNRAKPWDLAFPAPQVTNSVPSPTIETAVGNTNRNEEIANLNHELPSKENAKDLEPFRNYENQLLQTQKQLLLDNENLRNQLFQTQNKQKTASAETEIAQDKLVRDCNTRIREMMVERDIAVGKVSHLEALCAGYQARMRKDQITAIAPFANSPVDKPPELTADDESWSWPGTKHYRQVVEEKIRCSIRQLTPVAQPKRAKAQLTFNIQEDGSPTDIAVIVSEPMQNIAELDSIAHQAKNILLTAAPFHPLHALPFSTLKMIVEIRQEPINNSMKYSVSARFADKSLTSPPDSPLENSRGWSK